MKRKGTKKKTNYHLPFIVKTNTKETISFLNSPIVIAVMFTHVDTEVHGSFNFSSSDA